MNTSAALESTIDEKKFVQSCEDKMPEWLRSAIDGSDTKDIVERMNELNKRKEACLKRLEQMKVSENNLVVEKKVAANDCKMKIQRKVCKGSML